MVQKRRRIAVVAGDGIGPEVIGEGVKLLQLLDEMHGLNLELVHKDWGAQRWLDEGVGLPEGAIEDLRENYDAIYFGALGDPRIPDMAHGRDILLGMRFGLDLFVNMRPIKVTDPDRSPLKQADGIDILVFRENTEDCYVSMGGNLKKGTPDEVAVDESVHTYKGVQRVVRHAFEHAHQMGRGKVTLADKSNAVRFGGSLWQRVFNAVASDYPGIESQHEFIDVMAMNMVLKPQSLDVVVTSNLFGDILTDLGAGIMGGLGLAASGNVHPGSIGLFEPVHGSAPDISGKGVANPLAAFATAGMMLDFLGVQTAKRAIDTVISQSLSWEARTPDLGGRATTQQVGERFREALAELR